MIQTLPGFFFATGIFLFVFSLFDGVFKFKGAEIPSLDNRGKLTIKILGIALFITGIIIFLTTKNPSPLISSCDETNGRPPCLIHSSDQAFKKYHPTPNKALSLEAELLIKGKKIRPEDCAWLCEYAPFIGCKSFNYYNNGSACDLSRYTLGHPDTKEIPSPDNMKYTYYEKK